jgi:hypothetical protein
MDQAWGALIAGMGEWHQWKLFLEHGIAIEHDALHILAGVIAWIAFALILRRPLASWRPFWWLVALIGWNEAVDLWVEQWPDLGQQLGEGAKDLVLTIAVPALLTLLMRRRPALFAVKGK